MLDESFLTRLSSAFPHIYPAADQLAIEDAARLRKATGGDVQKALLRARFEGAGRLWWPYVKGSVPVVGDERDAMERFVRLILTVDHLVGHVPPSEEAARAQVIEVLRNSLDVERLKRLVERDAKDSRGAKTAAGAGLFAGLAALYAPIGTVRTAAKWTRWVPLPLRITAGVVVLGALASIPLVAGYSAGRRAEQSARMAGHAEPDARSTELPHPRAVP